MADERTMRLSQAARVLNVGVPTVVSHLTAKGFKVDNNPNTKLNAEHLDFLAKDFKSNALLDGAASKKPVEATPAVTTTTSNSKQDDDIPTWFRGSSAPEAAPVAEVAKPAITKPEPEVIRASAQVTGLKVIDKIDLNAPIKPVQKPIELVSEPVVAKQPEVIVPTIEVAPIAIPEPVQEIKVPEPVVVVEPKIEKVETPKPVVVAPPAPVAERPAPVVVVATPQPEIKEPIAIEKVPEKVVVAETKVVEEVKVAEVAPVKEKPATPQTPTVPPPPPKVNQAEKPTATAVVPTPTPVVEKPAETELIEAKGDQQKA